MRDNELEQQYESNYVSGTCDPDPRISPVSDQSYFLDAGIYFYFSY